MENTVLVSLSKGHISYWACFFICKKKIFELKKKRSLSNNKPENAFNVLEEVQPMQWIQNLMERQKTQQ